jgi:hypothetical protein
MLNGDSFPVADTRWFRHASAVEGTMSDERRDYAVLISLATREEAEVAAAALRADGVDAFIGNTNHASIEWWLVPALGGVQIMTPRERLTEARAILRDRLRAADEVDKDETLVRRDRWKAWILVAYYVVPLAIGYAIWFAWMVANGWTPGEWLGPQVSYPGEVVPLDLDPY